LLLVADGMGARLGRGRGADGRRHDLRRTRQERRSYARALLGDDEDRTLELKPHAHFSAALPFRPRVAPEVAAGEGATLEVSPATRQVPPALPFAPAPALPFAPAPARRCGRLQHFDTQTGKPLATPIWVDEPETPGR
jgi:hypothetical protein